MTQWISGLTGLEQVFFFCALVAGGLFLVRFVLQLAGVFDTDVGSDITLDTDADISIDADGAGLDAAAGDSDVSFKFFSLNGLLAFVMMFGLVGLTASQEFGAGPAAAIVSGFFGGMVAMLIVQAIFTGMMRMQSSGTLDLRNAVGVEGSVYLTIPAGGRGKVRLAFQNRLRVLDAVAERPVDVKTGTHVRVVRVIEGNVLVVEKA